MNMLEVSKLVAADLAVLFDPPPETVNELDIVWGVTNIARAIGRTRRQTHYALKKGQLPEARQVNGRWCISRAALINHFPSSA
jgi:hypothetical protein